MDTDQPAVAAAPPATEPSIRLEPFAMRHALDILGTTSWPEGVATLATNGPTFTLRHADGRLVGCVGVTFAVPWAGELWTLFTPAAAEAPAACFAHVENILRHCIATYRPHRISTLAAAKDTGRLTMLTRLGFVKEGTLRQLSPLAQDLDVYSVLPIIVPAHGEGQ